jgi:hypothetical protein
LPGVAAKGDKLAIMSLHHQRKGLTAVEIFLRVDFDFWLGKLTPELTTELPGKVDTPIFGRNNSPPPLRSNGIQKPETKI